VAASTLTVFDTAYKQIVEAQRVVYLQDFTIDLVEDWARAKLASGTRGQTVNLYVISLKGMFKWAVDNELILRNPLRRWQNVCLSDPIKRRDLQSEEVQAILGAEKNQECKLRWLVYFYTGLRLMAGSSLDWEWLDWQQRVLRLPLKANKSKKLLEIPVHPQLYEALEKIWKERGQPLKGEVFLKSFARRRLLQKFKWVCRKAGVDLDGVTLHSIRHTFATLLYEGTGKDIKAVQEILGHSSPMISLRYLHLTQQEKTNAVLTVNYK
jgi:integrase